jgi:hypothetical protein
MRAVVAAGYVWRISPKITTTEDDMTAPAQDSTAQSTSNVLSILAIVFGVVAAIFLPIVFGIAGIACGGVAVAKHERLGKIGLAVAIVGTILGFALGALIYSKR